MAITGVTGTELPSGVTLPEGVSITATIFIEPTFIPATFLPECGDMYKVTLSVRIIAPPFVSQLFLINANLSPVVPVFSKRHGYFLDYPSEMTDNEGNLGRINFSIPGFSFGEDSLTEGIEIVRRIAVIRPTTDLGAVEFAALHPILPSGEPCFYINTPANRTLSVSGSIQIYDGAFYSDPAVFQTASYSLPSLSCEGILGPDDPPWETTDIPTSGVGIECVPVVVTTRNTALVTPTVRTEI